MNTSTLEMVSLVKFWHIIHVIIREFLKITEPHIEEAAVRNKSPLELYYYSELGLDTFSIEKFQNRDPFSNPEQFKRLFPRLEVKGWIVPVNGDGRYEVTPRARDAVRGIIQTGDLQLVKFESVADFDLEQLLSFLKLIVLANNAAPEPPYKWATLTRFHVATEDSPLIVQIREHMMDLFAYRDDAYLTAARPHFNRAGIVWSAFGSIATGSAVTAEKMTETMSFRGYDTDDYELAIIAAIEVGWLEPAEVVGTFCLTAKGKELREQVEKLTDEYFYRPWVNFQPTDLDEFYDLLVKLRDQLHAFAKDSG